MENSYTRCPYPIKQIIQTSIGHEGGYVNDPSDSGGETNFGITKRVAESFREFWDYYDWDGDMSRMPEEFALDVYAWEYYERPKFNLMEKVSLIITQELFDTGINMGTTKPVKYLQRWLNVFLQSDDLVVDGYMGQKTVQSYHDLCKKRGVADTENVIYNCLNALQCVSYLEIAEERPKDEKFVWGWVKNRVDYKPF